MSKYKPLSERLSAHGDEEWRASFSELEEVLGFPLPKGARAGAAWWANDADKGHSRAWTGAGWQVAEVDRAVEAVTFRRHAQPSVHDPDAPRPEQGAGGKAAAEYEAQAPDFNEVQPDAMRKAAQDLSRRFRLKKAAPLIAAGAAVVAGLAALAVRQVRASRVQP